ncbi:MAG: hypothetical protein AB1552_14085 [Nitrospirota bacterium]
MAWPKGKPRKSLALPETRIIEEQEEKVPDEGIFFIEQRISTECAYVDRIMLDPLQKKELEERMRRISEFGYNDDEVKRIAAREWRERYKVVNEIQWERI